MLPMNIRLQHVPCKYLSENRFLFLRYVVGLRGKALVAGGHKGASVKRI